MKSELEIEQRNRQLSASLPARLIYDDERFLAFLPPVVLLVPLQLEKK